MNEIKKIIDKINRSILGDEEVNKVIDILKSGLLSRPGGGPAVQKFQSLMACRFGKKYAYGVNSGTSSLHLAVSSLGLKEKDEIIVPALANIADCSVVMQEGGRPVFADVDLKTFNVDFQDVERKITKNTRAIIVVHMYGEPVEIDKVINIAKRNNLVLIEDCAQASGARYAGRYVGSFGDINCFSFYQTKHIVTGEGGMVLTNNEEWSKIIDSLANNGIKKDNIDAYDYNRVGYNYQMTEIQAAQGMVQLGKLDELNKIRRQNADLYKQQLSDTGIIFQKTNPNSESAYFYLTGLLPERLASKRNEFLDRVKNKMVPIKNLYPLSLPEIELFKDKALDDCPVARNITKRLFNLYVNPGLKRKDIINFSNIIKDVYQKL